MTPVHRAQELANGGAPAQAMPPPAEAACMACGHVLANHDAIAQRYCNATVEHAATRGCICAVPVA